MTDWKERACMSAGMTSRSTMSTHSCLSVLMLMSTVIADSTAAAWSTFTSVITGSMPPCALIALETTSTSLLIYVSYLLQKSICSFKWCNLTLQSAKVITAPHRKIRSWYNGHCRVGCYIWYSEEGTGQGRSPPRPSSLYQM